MFLRISEPLCLSLVPTYTCSDPSHATFKKSFIFYTEVFTEIIKLRNLEETNSILKNCDEQRQVFTENLQKIRQRPGKKPVHDWRVSVKKIRSFLRLREAITHETWKEEFADTKTLFGIMGKQRDVEMSQGLLAKYQQSGGTELTSFKKSLAADLSLTRKTVTEAVKAYNETGLLLLMEKLRLSLQMIPRPQEKITHAVDENIKNVIVAMQDFKKNAHAIRKLLKDVYYWLKLVPEVKYFDRKQLKLLDTILDRLGQWQDHFVFQRKLKIYRREFLVKPTEEYIASKTLEQDITAMQEKLLVEAEEGVRVLLSKTSTVTIN